METKKAEEKIDDRILEFKKRILEWYNPVEFVNNLYGSHPDDNGVDYFKIIYQKSLTNES